MKAKKDFQLYIKPRNGSNIEGECKTLSHINTKLRYGLDIAPTQEHMEISTLLPKSKKDWAIFLRPLLRIAEIP